MEDLESVKGNIGIKVKRTHIHDFFSAAWIDANKVIRHEKVY